MVLRGLGLFCGEAGTTLVVFLFFDGINQDLVGGLHSLKLGDHFDFMARIPIWMIEFGK